MVSYVKAHRLLSSTLFLIPETPVYVYRNLIQAGVTPCLAHRRHGMHRSEPAARQSRCAGTAPCPVSGVAWILSC